MDLDSSTFIDKNKNCFELSLMQNDAVLHYKMHSSLKELCVGRLKGNSVLHFP